MAITPNSASTPPHLAGTSALNPAVVNVRRPGAIRSELTVEIEEDVVVASLVDDERSLPPTVLRLPHLDATLRGASTGHSIASIAHWVAIVLGGLLALWLIFAGRAKPLEDIEANPASGGAARAATSDTPEWNAPPLPSAGESQAPTWTPPPLPSAGESSAPKWTPPAASAPAATPAPAAQEPAPAAPTTTEPAATEDMPTHETWPQSAPDAAPPAEPELSAPETAARPATQPPIRTAQREVPVVEQTTPVAPDDDAQPLGITVPVPQ